MSKHTPGPWHWINAATDEPFDFFASGRYGYPSLRTVAKEKDPIDGWMLPKWILEVEEMWADTAEENLANARLVAAAPDFLDMAIAHDAYMLDAGYSGPDDIALHPKAAENWKRCRAVIAKATGEA